VPRAARPTAGRLAKARPLVLGATLAGLLVAAALQYGNTGSARSVNLLPATLLAEFSPYLESAYRDGAGIGPRFFGTVTDGWNSLPENTQREEAERIAGRLRWSGVEEVMLFDKQRRLAARYLRGQVVHPRPKPD
jgi:hypothetical protein